MKTVSAERTASARRRRRSATPRSAAAPQRHPQLASTRILHRPLLPRRLPNSATLDYSVNRSNPPRATTPSAAPTRPRASPELPAVGYLKDDAEVVAAVANLNDGLRAIRAIRSFMRPTDPRVRPPRPPSVRFPCPAPCEFIAVQRSSLSVRRASSRRLRARLPPFDARARRSSSRVVGITAVAKLCIRRFRRRDFRTRMRPLP